MLTLLTKARRSCGENANVVNIGTERDLRQDVSVHTHQQRQGRYHHGDLANALVAAATRLARDGGPQAVVLREAARQVGVSATAAYRHYNGHNDLIDAVRAESHDRLAETMRTQLAECDAAGRNPATDPTVALERLRALGRGYLNFALSEPGLFRTACVRIDCDNGLVPVETSPPYILLAGVIDELVACGVITPDRRPYSELVIWSAVHGLAILLLDGPLQSLTRTQRDELIERTFEFCRDAVCSPGRA